MLYYIIALGAVGGVILLLLPPRYKALIALVIMTSCFDLAPRIMAGIDTWDVGAVLLLLTAVDLVMFRGRPRFGAAGTPGFVTAFAVFYIWMLICFACSLLVYGYPFLATLKIARQMLIGFLAIFIFVRLFATDEGGLETVLRGLYWITLALLPLAILQYTLHTQILAGTYRDYSDVTRYLPSFLSFCLLFFWQILARLLSGTPLKAHEMLYSLLLLTVVVTSYTRGIYASVILGAAFVAWSLLSANRLRAGSVLKTGLIAAMGLAVVLFAGGLDRAIARFSSAVDIVTAHTTASKAVDDTFTGRLKIVGERAALVAQYNPFMGFGFLHDDLVPREIMQGLKYGSVIYTEQYIKRYASGYPYAIALHSADAGWADMILNTGFVGLALFALAIFLFVAGHLSSRAPTTGEPFYWRLAFFTQTMLFVVLMVESNPFVTNVQMAGFMIAGYVTVSRKPVRKTQPVPAAVRA